MIARVIAGLLVLMTIAVLPGSARADVDPEPPGTPPLRRLQGVWKVRAVLVLGMERARGGTYTFDKDKVTFTPEDGKAAPREMKLVPDKTRKDLFEMRRKSRDSIRYFFKLEKGELYLVPVIPDNSNPKPDFSGDKALVIILKREKK